MCHQFTFNTYDDRSKMPVWTPDHSMILSLLLDVVVGTKEEIAMRQDFCRIHDSLFPSPMFVQTYFTGSKSEGLDLPGSDQDYMFDINNMHHIKVIQSYDEELGFSNNSIFVMCTENIPPGFVLLRHVHPSPLHPFLYRSSRNINGLWYLSSDLFINNEVSDKKQEYIYEGINVTIQRQGPSIETWSQLQDRSESGMDCVCSIHCAFWPNDASEWVQRPRHFEWPASQDISSIIDFGFHLVPVGHPKSETKLMEWRISFSLAERTLVWSFNQVQMQCYAVMKIILKEFIKVKCNPENQVLCSYFIKTFLFWKYENTEMNFWRADNFRECIKYLLTEFCKCIGEGVLRHYFIRRFNLLSVKLTRADQTELLQLFDIIIQSDISILKECRTLCDIWLEFLHVHQDRINVLQNIKQRNFLRNDECAMRIIQIIDIHIAPYCRVYSVISSNEVIQTLLRLSCKTPIKTLALRKCLLEEHLGIVTHKNDPGNKGVYQLCRTAKTDAHSSDISTCKLWCAMLFYKQRSILSTLDYVNNVLSSISPFAMYMGDTEIRTCNESKQLYANMFLDSDIPISQRARTAWLFDLCITADTTNVVPLAIQIEMFFHCDHSIPVLFLSPFTCTYYLQFLCYHDMHQYTNRDRALQQLIDIVNDIDQIRIGDSYISLNITGHCLLLAGRRHEALVMFQRSYSFTQLHHTVIHQLNSATWYLHNCF